MKISRGGVETFRRGKKNRRVRSSLIIGILVVLVAVAVFVFAGSQKAEPTNEQPVATESTTVPEDAVDEPAAPTLLPGPPTPYFASYRSLRLCLPIHEDEITLLAYHQASGERAMHMESLVPDADMEALAARAQDQDFTTSAALADETGSCDDAASALWHGEALRLWRSNRRGEPDTAADVGACPGAQVRAPVSGTVIAVRSYELYGEWEDYEIHIQPDGWPEVDVVLIHVTDVTVSEGDQVVGGRTPIAHVRQLSDKVDLQLAGYEPAGGDHVHLQLNELPDPAMLEFIGDS